MLGIIVSFIPIEHFYGVGFNDSFCDHWMLGWPLEIGMLQHGIKWQSHIEIDLASLVINTLVWYLVLIILQIAYLFFQKRWTKK